MEQEYTPFEGSPESMIWGMLEGMDIRVRLTGRSFLVSIDAYTMGMGVFTEFTDAHGGTITGIDYETNVDAWEHDNG